MKRASKLKNRPLCGVNGIVVKFGGLSGICGSVSVGEPAYCMAHGNTKCKHKIKQNNDND